MTHQRSHDATQHDTGPGQRPKLATEEKGARTAKQVRHMGWTTQTACENPPGNEHAPSLGAIIEGRQGLPGREQGQPTARGRQMKEGPEGAGPAGAPTHEAQADGHNKPAWGVHNSAHTTQASTTDAKSTHPKAQSNAPPYCWGQCPGAAASIHSNASSVGSTCMRRSTGAPPMHCWKGGWRGTPHR